MQMPGTLSGPTKPDAVKMGPKDLCMNASRLGKNLRAELPNLFHAIMHIENDRF